MPRNEKLMHLVDEWFSLPRNATETVNGRLEWLNMVNPHWAPEQWTTAEKIRNESHIGEHYHEMFHDNEGLI